MRLSGYCQVVGGALMVFSLPAPLHGQRPPTPPARAAPVVHDPRDDGFMAWQTDANSAHAEPIHLTGGRYEVLVRSPLAQARERRTTDLQTVVVRCSDRFDLSLTQRTAVGVRAPWSELEVAAAASPFIEITVAPAQARPIDCARSASERSAIFRNGIRFGDDTLGSIANDVAAVEVFVGSRPVVPVLIGSAPILKVAPEGVVVPDVTHLIRLYLRYDELAPNDSGQTPSISLKIWSQIADSPQLVVIDHVDHGALWSEIIPWRVARLAGEPVPSTLPVALPTPRDARLREARAAYEAGRFSAAGLLALARLDEDGLRRDDRISARMQVALTLAAYGDTAAARVLLRAAFQDERCLDLPVAVSASLRTLVGSMRPPSRCVALPTSEVLKLALIPGRGQRALEPSRRQAGGYVMLATVALGGASVVYHASARQLHQQYEADTKDPTRAYARAAASRKWGNRAAIGTYAVWGGAMLHAVLTERAFDRRLRRVSRYGGCDARPVEVRPATSGAGLAIHFF